MAARGESNPGPGSVSQGGRGGGISYGDSRKAAGRYRYKTSSAGVFVELAPMYLPSSDDLFQWLGACREVARVEWDTSKAAQWSTGHHYSDQNIKVFPNADSRGSATPEYLEFEIVRSPVYHLCCDTPLQRPHTVPVMFKPPPLQPGSVRRPG